jgi:anthranilate/para-aminobenzoate synthase component II
MSLNKQQQQQQQQLKVYHKTYSPYFVKYHPECLETKELGHKE